MQIAMTDTMYQLVKFLNKRTAIDAKQTSQMKSSRGFLYHLCFCVLSFSCFRVCSLLPFGHLLGRADLLALVGDVYCIFVTFPCGILGQVRFLIVSFPDLCRLSYCFFIDDNINKRFRTTPRMPFKSHLIVYN